MWYTGGTDVHTALCGLFYLLSDSRLNIFWHIMIIVNKHDKITTPDFSDYLIDPGALENLFFSAHVFVSRSTLTRDLGLGYKDSG